MYYIYFFCLELTQLPNRNKFTTKIWPNPNLVINPWKEDGKCILYQMILRYSYQNPINKRHMYITIHYMSFNC